MGTLKDTQRHTWPSRHTKALPGMYRHPHRVMVTKRPRHMGMSDSCSQHHSVTEGNCHFCVYPKCLHPPFLIHGMFVLIGQEENLLALKLPIFWAYHHLCSKWRGVEGQRTIPSLIQDHTPHLPHWAWPAVTMQHIAHSLVQLLPGYTQGWWFS